MPDLFEDWYNNVVDIETLLAVDFEGRETTEPHLAVRCDVDDSTSLVIGPDGTEEVSSARVQFPVDVLPWLTPGSTVTLNPGDRPRLVIVVSPSVKGDQDLDGVSVALR